MPKYIIGIDEVGRGPIAGPVAVCAFLCEPTFFPITEIDLPMRDSKKLTKIQREKWFEYLKNEKKKRKCDFAVSYVSAEMIDKFGIVKAIQKSLDTALAKLDFQNFCRVVPDRLLASSHRRFPFGNQIKNEAVHSLSPREVKRENFDKPILPSNLFVYLDGGLKAPAEYVHQQTIIKGDELHPVISCASIVAKVSRDKIMAIHNKEYPEYGFEKHAGYGTKAHYEAIKKHGATPLHRKTFLKGIV